MATLATLEGDGILVRVDVPLPPRTQPWRRIYGSQGFIVWLETALPLIPREWDALVEPDQQVYDLLQRFIAGEPLTWKKEFHPMSPVGHGVWELKTPDTRIFGWFAVGDCFVAVEGHDASRVKKHDLYPGFRDSVVRFRENLDLDHPKYVAGDDRNAVLSVSD